MPTKLKLGELPMNNKQKFCKFIKKFESGRTVIDQIDDFDI